VTNRAIGTNSARLRLPASRACTARDAGCRLVPHPPRPRWVTNRVPSGAAISCGLADHAGPHGKGDHLRTVSCAEFAPDPGQVTLHRERRQVECLADLLVALAIGDQL
jgi:hypothetical protein